jgi:hypothetical protein
MAPVVAVLFGLLAIVGLVLVGVLGIRKGWFRREEDLPSSPQVSTGVSAQSKAASVKLPVTAMREGQHYDEDFIEMLELRHGYFPKRFVWREREYQVCAVASAWKESRRVGKDLLVRYVFRVCCAEETFEICWDVQQEVWCMSPRPRFVQIRKPSIL